jgi:hypothetical protein
LARGASRDPVGPGCGLDTRRGQADLADRFGEAVPWPVTGVVTFVGLALLALGDMASK